MPEMILLTGISGVGKSTLLEAFLRKYSPKLITPISNTTRAPKPRDSNSSKKYEYISEEEFKIRIKQNYFLEWEKVHSKYYGTPKHFLKKAYLYEKDLILDMDPKGAVNLLKQKELYKGFEIKAFFIWRKINPLNDFSMADFIRSIEQNLLLRGDDSSDLIERVKSAIYEYELAKLYRRFFNFIENDGATNKAFLEIDIMVA